MYLSQLDSTQLQVEKLVPQQQPQGTVKKQRNTGIFSCILPTQVNRKEKHTQGYVLYAV